MNEVISINIDAIEDFENIDRNKFYPVTSNENGDYIGFIHSKEIEQLEFQSSAHDFNRALLRLRVLNCFHS